MHISGMGRLGQPLSLRFWGWSRFDEDSHAVPRLWGSEPVQPNASYLLFKILSVMSSLLRAGDYLGSFLLNRPALEGTRKE
jgi:hypothetical protein